MNATYVMRQGNEVYVYVRGRLVMKRWLNTGVSVTFHVSPSGERWSYPKKNKMRYIAIKGTEKV
jgi:hypothetical protein